MQIKIKEVPSVKTKLVMPTNEAIKEAGEIIRSGNLVGMPTETVYGLAANAYDEKAVKSIFYAKKRPQDNPLIVHVNSVEMAQSLALEIPKLAKDLMNKFWPGALTIILKKSKNVPYTVSAGLDTVAVRLPSHSVAKKLIDEAGVPIAAPSANLSGKPSPTKASHVYDDFSGVIPMILDGGDCNVGIESTVVSLDNDIIKVLRPGEITIEMLSSVCENIAIDDAVLNPLREGEKISSPGMKYKHYSPKANVTILKGTLENFCDYFNENKGEKTYALVFNGEDKKLKGNVLTYGSDTKDQAQKLFSVLRELDKLEAKEVFVRCPNLDGVGLAVYNRLIRAAGFNVLEV